MTRVPHEIYKLIIAEVDSLHRNVLHPLLSVSHATYQMIVPAMYECILVDDKEFNKDETVKNGYGPCTLISPSRLPQLTDALKQNPKLAKYNTALILERPFPSTADRSFKLDIFQTIYHLRCLQRLCIATYSRAETHILWRLLPDYLRSSSIALTHLSVTSLNNPTITNTLEACSSSLRFLSSKNNAGPESMYLPASLGALETLDVGYTLDREGVVKISGSPMRHLFILALTSFSAVAHPQDLFANLTTLKARLILAGALPRFAPYLKNLRMLHVTAINADDTEVSVQFPSGEWLLSLTLLSFLLRWKESTLQQFTNISSPFLAYIHVGCIAGSPKQSETPALQHLFDHYPSLLAVDITANYRAGDDRLPPCFRYFRSVDSPEEVHIRPTGVFENWWEPLRDGLVLDV